VLSSRHASFGVAGVGTALTALYAAQVTSTLDNVALVVIGLGACLVQLIGIRVNKPDAARPWFTFVGGSVVFLIGVMIRPWAVEQPGLVSVSGDLFTMLGYALLAAGLVLLLRGRKGLQRHAVTDGLIICLGAGAVVAKYFALPAARVGDRPEGISLLAGLYPLWDVVILLLVLNLGFSTASRLAAFRFFAASMVMLFIGDLGYAWIGANGHLYGSPLLDLPFLEGFVLIGAAALHPSMAQMSSVTARLVQAWSLPRLGLILPALAAPLVILLLPGLTRADRPVLVLALAGLIAALLVRAVSAVRSHATIQEGLQYQAMHDPLTGLPNRVLLSEQVTELLRSARAKQREAWLLFLDLDSFKLVNDHWGHEVGDDLLVETSRRLVALAPERSSVARISGDEFVVSGPGTLMTAIELAERIQQTLAEPVQLPGAELIVSGSIGIAAVSDQRTAEALLRDADLAMYRAKAEGKKRWKVFDARMRQTVRDRVETELALRHAMTTHQLWVAFQPIVDSETSRVVGAEALLRWTHPVRGMIPPNDFIPVAEETGLIDEIGVSVVEESLRQVAVWRDEGILPDDFYVSVNASTRQLRDHGLRDIVDQALQRHRLGGDRLVLEITESIMMGDTDSVTEVLGGIRSLGVGLSVDDFGTGYSSLSYLSRFPVTAVKIDRAFVSGLGMDPGDEAIVRAVVAMASALKLTVIAEGVETEQQRDALRLLDVPLCQGWLWAKAEASDVFADRHLRGAMAPLGVQAGVGNS
jgi:diguanylate cyclase (GGDEF)-like protein